MITTENTLKFLYMSGLLFYVLAAWACFKVTFRKFKTYEDGFLAGISRGVDLLFRFFVGVLMVLDLIMFFKTYKLVIDVLAF